jgi:hypothetical protein
MQDSTVVGNSKDETRRNQNESDTKVAVSLALKCRNHVDTVLKLATNAFFCLYSSACCITFNAMILVAIDNSPSINMFPYMGRTHITLLRSSSARSHHPLAASDCLPWKTASSISLLPNNVRNRACLIMRHDMTVDDSDLDFKSNHGVSGSFFFRLFWRQQPLWMSELLLD